MRGGDEVRMERARGGGGDKRLSRGEEKVSKRKRVQAAGDGSEEVFEACCRDRRGSAVRKRGAI